MILGQCVCPISLLGEGLPQGRVHAGFQHPTTGQGDRVSPPAYMQPSPFPFLLCALVCGCSM